ncbi:DUF979 domain-containing protein [Polymorphobacter fuscus]|uniref:DUF979 family protein n=1 Tax=Sandarakinorhabdus fusca TaxID=1439888 RepID=A0A7C9GQD8_9SPHN|nr:DUF979 domain-containing protein [Polymorphobacter fuscus]KAB7646349.1 DUF979 domain-containing protein [Polymorphobacter fuscus]MQT17576.1 DUF979 family protein [Polymorphobacter fuscus]NJC09881.1 putative membrane protein [Polymorphobacter fuscus]
MIGLPFVYAVAGSVFGAWAVLTLADRRQPRRWTSAAFWGLISLSFLAGDRIGDLGNGVLVLALVAIGGSGWLARAEPPTTSDADRAASAAVRGNRLLLPALIVPTVALAGTLAAPVLGFVDPKQVTLVCLAAGAIIAVGVTMWWLRPPPLAPLQEGRRLVSQIGWAILLPQLLASLGAVFALSGVGTIIGGSVGTLIPDGARFIAVAVFTLGMAGFTMVMGNAFAAFPVMMAAVGLPVLVQALGGNPAIVAAIGMLAGFCGTLLTPMAANFNIVPAALLELDDRSGVIKAQVATALPLLAINTLLIWGLAFR